MDPIKLTRTVNILLVEDSASDIRLIREALRDSKLAVYLNVAHDGAEAINYLERCKAGVNSLPDIVLLDLNLPKKNGREVLGVIKQDSFLRRLPVIVMTSSNSDDDVAAVYRLNANCYIRKPFDLHDYEKVIRALEDFWFMTVMLPDGYNSGKASARETAQRVIQ
jgi:CheY-like chemotaxis protein